MGMGNDGKQLLWLLPKGWDLQDGAIAFREGSGATRERGLGPPGSLRAAAAFCWGWDTGFGAFLFFCLFICISPDCHGVCLPNIFLCW